MTKELAATVTKFISENQTHTPGQSVSAPAATPSPAQPAKRWAQQHCDWAHTAHRCCGRQGRRRMCHRHFRFSDVLKIEVATSPVTLPQAAV